MKPFHSSRKNSRGFSLVEGVLSIGIMSFGFLALAPLLAVGLTSARTAQANRATAEIAATLIEEAKQGTPAAAPLDFDSAGQPCGADQAAYVVQETAQPVPATGTTASLTRLTLRVTPVGAPGAARIYADVFPTAP